MLEKDILDAFYGHSRSKSSVDKYPLTNIAYDDSKIVYIEVAVAGFKKENMKIHIVDSNLVIEGVNENDSEMNMTYVRRNIAKRDFKRVIHLDAEYINGQFYADLEDGILLISISPKAPPSTVIPIN
jgi:HSP20 family molecular chaperone IbpA